MKLTRRVCDPPAELLFSRGGNRCPDIWETDSGDYLIIGRDVTESVLDQLPSGAEITSSEEKAVLVPKEILQSAAKNMTREAK